MKETQNEGNLPTGKKSGVSVKAACCETHTDLKSSSWQLHSSFVHLLHMNANKSLLEAEIYI